MSVSHLVSSLSEPAHHAFTVLSLGALLGWIAGALPVFSLSVTVLWGSLKVVETWYAIRLKHLEYKEQRKP